MKTSKLFLLIFAVSFCSPAVFAQKQLKYVPQALKGTKAVPYVLNPKIFSVARTNFVPVTRPNVTLAVERAVAAKVTVEERIIRLVRSEEYRHANENKKLEMNLALLEEYSREHNGKLPPYNGETEASILRTETARSLASSQYMRLLPPNHPLVLWYSRLSYMDRQQPKEKSQQQQREEQFIQELRAQEMEQERRAWRQVRLQDQSWKVQPEDIVPDPAENAGKAAALGEEQIAFPGNVTTDEYVEQLLRFYNQLDPLGTGTIQ